MRRPSCGTHRIPGGIPALTRNDARGGSFLSLNFRRGSFWRSAAPKGAVPGPRGLPRGLLPRFREAFVAEKRRARGPATCRARPRPDARGYLCRKEWRPSRGPLSERHLEGAVFAPPPHTLEPGPAEFVSRAGRCASKTRQCRAPSEIRDGIGGRSTEQEKNAAAGFDRVESKAEELKTMTGGNEQQAVATSGNSRADRHARSFLNLCRWLQIKSGGARARLRRRERVANLSNIQQTLRLRTHLMIDGRSGRCVHYTESPGILR